MLRYFGKERSSCWPRHVVCFSFVCIFSLLFWDPLWTVFRICRLISIAVSILLILGTWFVPKALLATMCTYGLVLTFSFMVSKRFTLETPQRVGNIRLNRSDEVSCLYWGCDPRGIKRRAVSGCRSVSSDCLKRYRFVCTDHTLIFEFLEDLFHCARYKITWSDHSFAGSQ